MAARNQKDDKPTAIAISKDSKSVQFGLKWAVDHLLPSSLRLTLVHVKLKNLQHQPSSVVRDPSQDVDVFAPYRGYCNRRRIRLREVVLEDNDIAKALLEFIEQNEINNFVIGASNTKNSLLRKGKQDISGIINKNAYDSCTVYVVTKSKVLTVRSALRSSVTTGQPPKQPSSGPPSDSGSDEAFRSQTAHKGARKGTPPYRAQTEKPLDRGSGRELLGNAASDRHSSATSITLDSADSVRGRSSTSLSSFSDDSDTDSLGFGSFDVTNFYVNFSSGPDTFSSPKDAEAEMNRLRDDLQHAIDMYSTACREALTAKRKAKELEDWKVEEARRFEVAKSAEEAALAIVEVEKARCKAAMEEAEAAQKMAELEIQRRKYAELRALRESEEKNRVMTALHQNDTRYRKYAITEIEVATENFAESNKIGEGGYGPVYKGKLDHTAVAIKVLKPDAAQGRKQFNQEVEVLSCMRHPNMVLLLGACPEYGCLVYEHMTNGSLEDRLFRRGGSPPLSWALRFKIAAEIATALLFLHQAKPEPLVHRDLKPGNILLDSNYVSKIADVGLARLVPPSVADTVTQYHMTSAAGTFCYIDPEYQQTGMLGIKSDIYSFGIVLLQIITAKPPMALSHHIERCLEKGTLEDMLDPTVTDWPMEETISFAKIALKCAELRKKDRPDLGSVVLPELIRLRDFGSYNETLNNTGSLSQSSCSNHTSSSSNHTSPHSRLSSSTASEVGIRRFSGDGRSSASDEHHNSYSRGHSSGNDQN